MSSRRPFLVLPRFPGASLIVLEPSTQWRQPDAARTPAQLAATVNTGLVVAVVASRERWASGVEHVLVFFFYDIYPEARQILSEIGVTLHSLATWWDVLAVAKARRHHFSPSRT